MKKFQINVFNNFLKTKFLFIKYIYKDTNDEFETNNDSMYLY